MHKICKECFIDKDISGYYTHPLGVMGTLGRCKECIKLGRRTPREREMARKLDNERYNQNPLRRVYVLNRNIEYSKLNIKKAQARQLSRRSAELNRYLLPLKCPITGGPIECLHHFDYDKPLDVVPCSVLGHFQFHKINPIEVKHEWIVLLPDVRKWVKKKSLFKIENRAF